MKQLNSIPYGVIHWTLTVLYKLDTNTFGNSPTESSMTNLLQSVRLVLIPLGGGHG